MCSTTTAAIYWTIVVPWLREKERRVCNGCELEYRRRRKERDAAA
jgi:hypothetical protein